MDEHEASGWSASAAAESPPDPGLTEDRDTGDVIDPNAPDPVPDAVEHLDDPSYVEPAHAAVRVNPELLLPAAEWIDDPEQANRHSQQLPLPAAEWINGPEQANRHSQQAPEAGAAGRMATSVPDAPDVNRIYDPPRFETAAEIVDGANSGAPCADIPCPPAPGEQA